MNKRKNNPHNRRDFLSSRPVSLAPPTSYNSGTKLRDHLELNMPVKDIVDLILQNLCPLVKHEANITCNFFNWNHPVLVLTIQAISYGGFGIRRYARSFGLFMSVLVACIWHEKSELH